MKKTLILALSLGFLGCFAAVAGHANEAEEIAEPVVINIELKEEADIADAKLVSAQIAVIAAKVMECIKTGEGTPQICQCNYPEEILQLKAIHDETLKKHPDWAGTVVNYNQETVGNYNQEKDIATAVSFPGLAEQFKRCPEGSVSQGYEAYEDVEVPEGEMGDAD